MANSGTLAMTLSSQVNGVTYEDKDVKNDEICVGKKKKKNRNSLLPVV